MQLLEEVSRGNGSASRIRLFVAVSVPSCSNSFVRTRTPFRKRLLV